MARHEESKVSESWRTLSVLKPWIRESLSCWVFATVDSLKNQKGPEIDQSMEKIIECLLNVLLDIKQRIIQFFCFV